MIPTITTRILTRVGAAYAHLAKKLANEAAATKLLSKNQIINGFLIRASGRLSKASDLVGTVEKASYTATVMDFPGFILFAGPLRYPWITAIGSAAPAGIRDDFDSPGTETTFEVLNKERLFVMMIPFGENQRAASSAWFPSLQQVDWYLGTSSLYVPMLAEFPDQRSWYLDDEKYLDFSCVVSVTAGIYSFLTAARSLDKVEGGAQFGAIKTNYFFRNQYIVDERELPDDWKLMPRRLLPYDPDNPTDVRRYPGMLMSGFAVIPASPLSELDGVDSICLAARTFRQHLQPWDGDFDRIGEQGLLVAVGELDRSRYNPQSGAIVFGATRRLRVIEPTDIEQDYLHPEPPTLPGNPETGRPELPNYGTFYNPTPVRIGNDFVVFSAYSTFRNLSGAVTPSGILDGDAWSLLTTLPSGRTVSLRADWNAREGEIETGVPGEFMQPVIVGGASVPIDRGATAYCLVWEQTYRRGLSATLKGNWALYETSGGTPSRTVIAGSAPLFALWMQTGPREFSHPDQDIISPFSAVYHAGDGKLVTSCIPYPPSPSSRSIRCAIFDVKTKSLRVGGEITTSREYYDKCIITVVQPFIPANGSAAAVPAVLLASVSRHLSANSGAGGKVFISVDGGDSWREYVTDAGAQAGAFYVGNKLWRFDLNTTLDGRNRA